MSATLIYAASLLLPLVAAYLLQKVSRDYRTLDRLSFSTSLSIWLLYLAHTLLTTWSAWLSLWPIPIRPFLAITIGITLLIAGSSLAAAGISAFGSLSRMSGTKADQLITKGAYRWSRNPQNVGLGIALIGMALLGRSSFSLLLAGYFWVTIGIYLPMEEAYLRRVFGESFVQYCRRTSRYFGFAGQ